MPLKITRCPENPIVWPGKWDWRMSNVYNRPGDCATERPGRPHLCDEPAVAPGLVGRLARAGRSG
jgi:hypothetical protein